MTVRRPDAAEEHYREGWRLVPRSPPLPAPPASAWTTEWPSKASCTAKAGSGAFNLPVTFPSRIGEPAGTTSPEELMAASHAACYAMALNATLGRKNASAALFTSAKVSHLALLPQVA